MSMLKKAMNYLASLRLSSPEEIYGTVGSETPDTWPWKSRMVSVKSLFKTLGFGAYIEKNGQKPENAMFPLDSYVLMVETVSTDGVPLGRKPVCDFYNKELMLKFCNMVSFQHACGILKAQEKAYQEALKIVEREFSKAGKFDSKSSKRLAEVEKNIKNNLACIIKTF